MNLEHRGNPNRYYLKNYFHFTSVHVVRIFFPLILFSSKLREAFKGDASASTFYLQLYYAKMLCRDK